MKQLLAGDDAARTPPRPSRMLLLAWCGVVACSGGESTGPGTGTNTNTGEFFLRMKVDGVQWESGPGGPQSTGLSVVLPGVFGIAGVQIGSHSLVLQLYNIGGPGTYPLGVGALVPGGSVQITNSAGSWYTPGSGADGTLNITTLTATRIAGTFSATLAPTSGTGAARTVSDGQFNLELKPVGTIGPLADNKGSKLSATAAGTAYNGANVAGSYLPSSQILTITSSTNTRTIGLSLTGITGPGTYALSATAPTRSISYSTLTSPLSTWSSSGAGGSGSVTITSITTTRIKGTFSGTLGPAAGSSATGTVTITNGTFDIGLP